MLRVAAPDLAPKSERSPPGRWVTEFGLGSMEGLAIVRDPTSRPGDDDFGADGPEDGDVWRGDEGGYASIKDVAGRAGVSFQTVSKVLNGGGSVSPATLERIRRAAEEVGYVPNARRTSPGICTRRPSSMGRAGGRRSAG